MFSFFQDEYPTKLFTYFIPAPPKRISGYREKQLDRMVNEILKNDFKLKDIKITSVSNDELMGMWVILHLQPTSKHGSILDINQLLDEIEAHVSLPMSEDNTDGLYPG